MTNPRNGDALRQLADGPKRARYVAAKVGWGVRTGGPRMRSLERHGLVRRIVVRPGTQGTAPQHKWELTEKGQWFVGPNQDP